MIITTKTVLTNIRNEPLKTSEESELTLGEALANIMLASPTAGKMKSYILAQRFMNEEKSEVEVDDADLALIKAEVEKTQAYNSNIVPGQILVILENIK